MAKIGVILSGCGVFDGSEIHEAVAVLHAIDRHGSQAVCLAPEMELDEINHLNQQPTGKKRSVLMEAARIARGDVTPLAKVKGGDFDAIVLPGGFGAAKNLCDFASKGAECSAHPEVTRVLTEAQRAGRPLGFACISPAVAARIFGADLGPNLTIGTDKGTADGLEAMGATHQDCEGEGIVFDNRHRIVSTPAYMCDQSIGAVFTGIGAMVDKVMEMVEQPAAV
ncbi:MAG: isoprenoid biosynthesis glyoxalase ElbB [Phycisphaerales bacterium]|jgi:enhancing lycopene biosynthesis protein 2